MAEPVYDLNFVGPATTYKKRLDNGLIVFFKSSKDELGRVVKTPVMQKVGESNKNFYKRIQDDYVKAGRAAGNAAQKVAVAALRTNIDDWSNNWLKTNVSKYAPREVDKFISDFKKDWAAEVKTKNYKTVAQFNPTDRNGFPTLTSRLGSERDFNFEGFLIDRNADRSEISFRKGFFANKLTDKTFKSKLDEYFDFIIKDKRGQGSQYLTVQKPDDIKDVIYLLSPDSGVTGVAQTSLFKGISPVLGAKFQDYIAKKNNTLNSNNKNLKLMAKKLNIRDKAGKLDENFFVNEMRREGDALKKIFDVKELPDELKLNKFGYSVEHTQGLAAALKTDDINIIRAASKDLAGMSSFRNTNLGFFSGFERNRGSFIQKIQEGLKNNVSVDKTVKDLNKMISSEYKDLSSNKTPYSIVDNKLQVSPISKAVNQEQRFGQYFNELANNPKTSQNLLQQINTKPELTKFIQEGTDPILTSLRSNVIKLAKNNTDDFCNILSMRKADGGRMGFAKGGSCATQVAQKFDEDPVKFAQDVNKIPEQPGIINKVKNFASKFLSVAKKGGRFGAFAAAGAATAGLVKEFRNDDPSTYLSNEDQQKNMLIDMLTQPVSTPTETPSTAFGDAQLPAIGAVTAAGMVPGGAELYRQRTGSGVMKGPLGGPRLDAEGAKIFKNRVSPARALLGPLSGVLGKGLAATGTPLGMAVLEPLYIGQQIADGDSAGEIATNPLNYLGPAFAGSLSKEATRFVGPKMANIMRLGISPMALKTVSRRFGLPGLGISAGISGYEMYQNKKAGRGIFDDG
jgi:hypothetical protein